VTQFRGFSQFGLIGAVGMIAAWLASATLLPSLIALSDQGPHVPAPARGLALSTSGRPRLVLALMALATLGSVLPLGRYLRDPFEYDFRKLRNRRAFHGEEGAAQLAPRVDAVFGRTITPSVVLADSRAHASEIARLILKRDLARPMLDEVSTLDDLLPGDRAEQDQKLALLADLRRLLDELEVKSDLRRIVLVYHAPSVDVWDGHQLMRLAQLLDPLPLADGTVARASGQAVVFTSMIHSIERDAPRATLASFVAVALLVLLMLGPRGALPVLAVLVAGVLWMLGAAAALGVRTNFLNFIALPITFGIGVDYGVNMVLRFRRDGTFASTAPAVALCSLTTIIGYGALLAADNQALRSFGALAILGELACLTAALLGLPALLRLRR
jgi:hypothetical protein